MRLSAGIARGPLMATLLVGVLGVLGACADDAVDAPIATHADSGFRLQANAFSFENFASGYDDARLSPTLVARMFGMDVCIGKASPCVLTPAASMWSNRVNASMDGGRCEGFAVLSALFYGGALDPSAFGGTSARSLSLDGNPPLQREIAYWFATQDVPTVAKTQKLGAKQGLAFLSTALRPDADELYRIGIVRKTSHGISGGHALTPIRYEPTGEPGVFALHVYDNNYPDEDRTMKIDIVKDRWEYRASANPGEDAALYFGDASNKNPLYFAKIKTRIGTLPAPFAHGAPESTTVFQGVNVSAADMMGNAAGVGPDGEVMESGGGSVAPSVSSAVPTWTAASPVNLFLPTGDTTLMVSGGDPAAVGAGAGTITQFGSGYTVDVSQLDVGLGLIDALSVSNGGHQIAYVNASHTPITLDSSVQSMDGQVLELRIEVPGGGTSVTTQLDPATGQIKVTADGTQGAMVTLTVTKVDTNTGATVTGTLTVDGAATNAITVDATKLIADGPLLAQQDTGTGSASVGSTCTDATKNGSETDVDCGGSCTTPCADGKGCSAPSDCMSSVCNLSTSLCVASPCLDGAKGGTETDVDCGGMCSTKCAFGKSCVGGADCTTGFCDAGLCTSLDRIVFVSSTTSDGNIGGLAGADAKCQAAALAGALPGTYKAFLSDSITSAFTRLSKGPGAYVLVDGVTIVAADANSFFAPAHALPIDKDEKNVATSGVEVWTGSQGFGALDGTATCANWTSSVDASLPYAGRSDFTDERWLSAGLSACNVARHLYCVQQ
jgi:hypothetical protein